MIGEFYGDLNIAIISRNERYFVIGEEGIIVYYLNKLYDKCSDKQSNHYFVWGRDNEKTIWVEDIEQIDDNHIKIIIEENIEYVIVIDYKGE